jgi:hypothetical protein
MFGSWSSMKMRGHDLMINISDLLRSALPKDLHVASWHQGDMREVCEHTKLGHKCKDMSLMTYAVFWDMTTRCGSYKNRRFSGTYRLNFQGEEILSPLGLQRGAPQDGRGREPLARVSPLSCLCVTVEIQLIGRCFVECDD